MKSQIIRLEHIKNKEEIMKSKQLQNIMKSKQMHIPLYLYRERKQYNIDAEAFLFLMYLVGEGEKILFDPTKIESDLNIELELVMKQIDILTEANLMTVEVEKNKQGVMEEYIILEKFWNKTTQLFIQEMNESKEVDPSTIYERIEQEFGRTLSPIEYEIIGAWIDSKISEELINEALKEAVFNGVNNLRYIDKILYEWGKKGYKTKADVEKQREKWKKEKDTSKAEKKVKKEVFDYNWLEEDEE